MSAPSSTGRPSEPVDIVDPRGMVREAPVLTLAPRLAAIAGRIGFMINEASRQQGPDFYGYTLDVEDGLRRRFGAAIAADSPRICKPVLSRPAGDDLLAHLRDCSGVVNGLAK
jgi:hypothetical protein